MALPFSTFIWMGTALFSISLIPQVTRTVRMGSAEDFSVPFIVMVQLASLFSAIYMFGVGEIVSACGFIINLTAWSVMLRYRLFPREASNS